MDPIVNQYLSAVKAELSCSHKQKQQLIKQLENSIDIYISENGNVDMDKLILEFGSPEEIAFSFLEDEPPASLRKRLSLKKNVVKTMIILGAILIAVFTILGTAYVVDFHSFTHGYYQDTVAEGTPPPPEGALQAY